MNSLYHWNDEHMVDWEMREIQREVAQANLLREAGLTGTGWLTRAWNALRNRLRTRDLEVQEPRTVEQQPYQSRGEKVAQ